MKRATGVNELIAHENGEKLGRKDAMLAKCAECMAQFADGRFDCEIPKCPLYPWMPYLGEKRPLSEG
jgi:hypothetical protein